MSAPGYDGSIRIDSRINTKGFNKGVRNLGRSLGGLTKVLKAVGAAAIAAFSVIGIVRFGAVAVDTASELSSALVGLQSVVEGQGRSFEQAQGFIEEYIKDGLIPATNAINAFKNLALRGYNTDQIETVMNALKDAAAFGRQSSYTMGEAVQSATEGLKNENSILVDNAGVTKNVAQMWDDYARSIGTTVNNLTQQQKIQAEVAGILEESRYQTGDAAKVSGTYAGVVMQLTAAFYNLKVAVGNIFMPILQQIIPIITTAVNWLTVLANRAAQFISLLLGRSITATATGMQDVADSTGAASDAQADLADNTRKAGEAAKGALAAFDDLNVLKTEDEGSSSGAGSDVGAGVPTSDIGAVLTEGKESDTLDSLQKTVARIKEFLAPLKEPLKGLWQALVNVWDAAKKAFEPVSEWYSEDGGEILAYIRDLAIDGIEWLTGRLGNLAVWIDENPDAFLFISLGLGLIAAALIAMTSPVLGVILFIAVLLPLLGIFGDKLRDELIPAAVAWYVVIAMVASAMSILLLPFAGLILGALSLIRAFNSLKDASIQTWEDLKTAWSEAKEWFRTNVASPVAGTFLLAWSIIRSGFASAFYGIVGIMSSVRDSIVSLIEQMVSTIKEKINGIIGRVNGAIGAINGIKVSIPSWVPIYGGSSFSPPRIATIPKLATGAVIPPNSEFLAVLGDQRSGRNLEAPEGLIRQIIQEEIGSIDTNVTIEFGGSLGALVRELKPYIDKENTRVGRSLVKGMPV